MRRAGVAAVAACSLVACAGDPTGRDTPRLSGTYALTSIDGAALPTRYDPTASPEARMHADTLTIVPGREYYEEVARFSVTPPDRPLVILRWPQTWRNDFEQHGDSIPFLNVVSGHGPARVYGRDSLVVFTDRVGRWAFRRVR